MQPSPSPLLVVSVHALDFLWRCGGTIARYVGAGERVKIIDLSFGERGESAELWTTMPELDVDGAKAIRREEAEKIAAVLGAEIEFLDWDDQPLVADKARILELARHIRAFRPRNLITHHTEDRLNPDHAVGAELVFQALRCAQVHGIEPGTPPVAGVSVFLFEPDQPEFCNFKPDVFVDISDVMPKKLEAMQVIMAQKFLIENYTQRAQYRGYLAGRQNGARNIRYAEAYKRFNCHVGTHLP